MHQIIQSSFGQDLDKHADRYWSIGSMDMRDVVGETGCDIPCKYTEYSLPSFMSIDTYKL